MITYNDKDGLEIDFTGECGWFTCFFFAIFLFIIAITTVSIIRIKTPTVIVPENTIDSAMNNTRDALQAHISNTNTHTIHDCLFHVEYEKLMQQLIRLKAGVDKEL